MAIYTFGYLQKCLLTVTHTHTHTDRETHTAPVLHIYVGLAQACQHEKLSKLYFLDARNREGSTYSMDDGDIKDGDHLDLPIHWLEHRMGKRHEQSSYLFR